MDIQIRLSIYYGVCDIHSLLDNAKNGDKKMRSRTSSFSQRRYAARLTKDVRHKEMRIEFTTADTYELSGFVFQKFAGKRYVVFDVEATGPDQNADSVTQIGAIVVDGHRMCMTASYMSLVKPWQSIPEKIEALTGVTNERVATAPGFAEAWAGFKTFCSDAVLVTQCGYEFDFPILDHECVRVNTPRLMTPRLDTKVIFALLHPEMTETFSTNFLCDYYGIDRSPFKRHDALGDSNLIARIFLAEMEEAKQLGIDALSADGIRIKRFILPPL